MKYCRYDAQFQSRVSALLDLQSKIAIICFARKWGTLNISKKIHNLTNHSQKMNSNNLECFDFKEEHDKLY